MKSNEKKIVNTDEEKKKRIIKDLMIIPGVGKSIANDLFGLGYKSINDLTGQNPEMMYERQCEIQGIRVDACLKYVFRCAVYFAETQNHDPELLKWWNWKNKFLENKK